MVITDDSSGDSETSPVISNTPGEWQVIDVSSLSFITSGDFWVYLYYSPSETAIGPYMDEDWTPIEHPGRFQQRHLSGSWEDRSDFGVRVIITVLPEHVIPETPLGTITVLLISIAATVLIKKPRYALRT